MQLKTCTNPDRIMKHRHKILHSMEIAFSHVLWFEKKRETDSERQMETRGVKRKRVEKRKETEMQGGRVSSSQMESHSAEEREQQGLGQAACPLPVSAPGSAERQSHGPRVPGPEPGPTLARWKPGDLYPLELGAGGFVLSLFLYVFCVSKFS